jgi:hypothetical protein
MLKSGSSSYLKSFVLKFRFLYNNSFVQCPAMCDYAFLRISPRYEDVRPQLTVG